MTGQELARVIQDNPFLCMADVKYTILHLLKEQLIQPSAIIDAYTETMVVKCNRMRAHFEDSCVTNHQLLNGRFKGKDLEEVKKRASYNTSFSSMLNGVEPIPLTEEEREECRINFEMHFGFNPEKE